MKSKTIHLETGHVLIIDEYGQVWTNSPAILDAAFSRAMHLAKAQQMKQILTKYGEVAA